MKQRTSEWFQARLGKVTASHIADVMRKTKSGYSATRENYLVDLVCERLTGEVAEHYVSKEMEWGIMQEENAITEYELATGNVVSFVGFVEHLALEQTGASPDGLVGEDGLVEVKCPTTKTHLKTLMGSPIDNDYMLQMQWQMACTGRAWCDFVSYDPRLPVGLQMEIRRVPRDNDLIETIESEVLDFLRQLDALEEKLRERINRPADYDVEPATVPEEKIELKDGEVF